MNILVIAAHPDDEVLGCGGTIARHADQGDDVFITILGEGIMARADSPDNSSLRDKQKGLKEQTIEVASILGAKEVINYNFPDNRMDSVDLLDIIKAVEKSIKNFKPEIIYTHYIGDLNIDHAITSRAVITATRPQPGNLVPELYAFEVLSSTEWFFGQGVDSFKPDYFVSINKYLEIKLKALSIYHSEIYEYPHPRSEKSIRTLAYLRGSQSGLESAEAFKLIRKIKA